MSRWLLPLCAILLSSAGAARAEWRAAESNQFTIYSQSDPAELHDAAADLDRFDRMLRRTLNLPAASPVALTIYLMPDQASIQKALGEEDDSGIAGFYAVSPRGAVAIGMQDNTGQTEFDLSRRDVLFHEYVHHLMAQHSDAAYPLWYSEGFAEYYAMTDLDADGAVRTGAAAPHRLAALRDGHWLPIGQLLAARGPADLDGQELMFYSQSWLLVHYLASEPARRGQIERYLLAINQGSTSQAAAIEAFGALDALEDALRDYARRPELASQLAAAPAASDPIAVRTLDAAAADVLPYEAALGRGIAPWSVKRFARDVRAVAARHPDDARALALRTTAELMVADRKAAAKAVDQWIALRPDEPRALMYKAMVGFAGLAARKSTSAAQWSAARQWLERARTLAPRDPMVMDIYYDSFAIQGITPSAEASDALIRAMQLVPQFDELRLKVASDYERRNHIEAAIRVVKPAVFRSEGPGASLDKPERAAEMLARLQRKLASAPPPMAATFRQPGPRSAD